MAPLKVIAISGNCGTVDLEPLIWLFFNEFYLFVGVLVASSPKDM